MQRLLEYSQNHLWLVLLSVAAAIAVLVYELRNMGARGSGLNPQDAVRLMNQGATILDVRSSEEFATGHIRGARHLADVANAAATHAKLRERAVLLCCEQGSRSAAAARKLAATGFSKVFNLRGGLKAWREANLPLTRE